MLEEVKSWAAYPVMAMVRSREGGFDYSNDEFVTMVRDARILLDHGADGIVFGFVSEGKVDADRTARMVGIADGVPTMFHRACDATDDIFATLETLAGLGVTRMLTSGQAGDAAKGVEVISELQLRARGRIQVLPGGAIEPHNVVDLVRRSGVDQVHFAARDDADSGGYAGVSEAKPNPAMIDGMRQALLAAGYA